MFTDRANGLKDNLLEFGGTKKRSLLMEFSRSEIPQLREIHPKQLALNTGSQTGGDKPTDPTHILQF